MESQDNFYDHYKDTFDLQKGYLKKRDSLTVVLLIMTAVLLLQIQAPNITQDIANILIKKQAEGVQIDFMYVNSILIFTYLWVVMQYYMIVLLIERNYTYIHSIEKKISNKGDYKIQREGVNYLQSYPWLKSLVNQIYKGIFPLLVIVVVIIKFIIEYQQQYEFIIFDAIILGLVFLLSLLYLSNRYFNEEYLSNKRYSRFSLYIRLKKYFIK
ncbi:MAG: hypothetical protein RSF40_11155 [Oscillospiraceae bacterium]